MNAKHPPCILDHPPPGAQREGVGIAQIAPFDAAAKQALLEAPNLAMRADLIVQLMRFFGRHDGEERVTLQ